MWAECRMGSSHTCNRTGHTQFQHGNGPHREWPLPVLELLHHVELSMDTYGGRRPRRATCRAKLSRGRLLVNFATRPSQLPIKYRSARKSRKPRHSAHAAADGGRDSARVTSPTPRAVPYWLRRRRCCEAGLPVCSGISRSRWRSQLTLPSRASASSTASPPLRMMGVRLPQRRTNSSAAFRESEARTTLRNPCARSILLACATYLGAAQGVAAISRRVRRKGRGRVGAR